MNLTFCQGYEDVNQFVVPLGSSNLKDWNRSKKVSSAPTIKSTRKENIHSEIDQKNEQDIYSWW
jgi:hypothetical protein